MRKTAAKRKLPEQKRKKQNARNEKRKRSSRLKRNRCRQSQRQLSRKPARGQQRRRNRFVQLVPVPSPPAVDSPVFRSTRPRLQERTRLKKSRRCTSPRRVSIKCWKHSSW